MPKPTDIRLCEASASTQYFKYRAPVKFGGRTVTDVVLLDVVVEVETREGRRGRGFGSMPMGNIWAWPSQKLSTEQTLAAMTEFAERTVHRAGDYHGVGHPLEITQELATLHQDDADELARSTALAEPMPRLAQLVAASPLE